MRTNTALSSTLTLRLASPADDPGIARLAELDSAVVPAGPVLLALVDGALHAAIALESGAVVADPFRPTAHLVDLLRDRAAVITGPATPRRASIASRLRAARSLRAAA